jgi:RNA polymerase sigma factor (sigma-70 family)
VHVLENTTGAPPPRYAEVVDGWRPKLQRIAFRVLGDHGQAEEVVQDVFVKLAESAVLGRPDDEVGAWLRRVTLNAAFNRGRSERRAQARIERVGRLETAGGTTTDTPLGAVLAEEERATVRQALALVPERQRAVLLLRHSGCSYAEIAAAAEIAVGSVGVLLARGERAFRTSYESVRSDRTGGAR